MGLILPGCNVAKNIKLGEYPNEKQGVAYSRIIVQGSPKEVKIFISNKAYEKRVYWAAKIDVHEGDKIYAVSLDEGEYDFSQVSINGGTGPLPENSQCPSFDVKEGYNNYSGTIYLNVIPTKWYGQMLGYTGKYNIKCVLSETDALEAETLLKAQYPLLGGKYPDHNNLD